MSDVLRQLYLVAPADEGWAVNFGAKAVKVLPTRAQARRLAMTLAIAAMAEGMALGFIDADLADEGDRTA